jgi:protein-S-isoprenylcysteine O-methyltransferase Ste14
MTSPIVKTVIFTILVPGTVAVVLPRAIGTDASAPTLDSSIGFLPMVLGVAIYLWCAWDFATAGQGTPAPIDAPKRLVVRGLYRFVRNPMYVGVLTVLFSESVVFRSRRILTYAIVVFLFFPPDGDALRRASAQAQVRRAVRGVFEKGATVDSAER